MKKTVISFWAVLACLLFAQAAMASEPDDFRQIKIFDSVRVFVDADGGTLDVVKLQEEAEKSFKEFMRGMPLNDDAFVNNYPKLGMNVKDVGIINIKVMTIKTKSGMNVYHLDFEFGVPPRQIYWDTAEMGIAPTAFDLDKAIRSDIGECMERFASDFHSIRGE